MEASSVTFVRSTVGLLVGVGLTSGTLVVSSSVCKSLFPCYLPKRRCGNNLVLLGDGAVKWLSRVCVSSWEAERFNPWRYAEICVLVRTWFYRFTYPSPFKIYKHFSTLCVWRIPLKNLSSHAFASTWRPFCRGRSFVPFVLVWLGEKNMSSFVFAFIA